MKKNIQPLVATCKTNLFNSEPENNYNDENVDIEINIDTLDVRDGQPRSFFLDYETTDTVGGSCSFRLLESLGHDRVKDCQYCFHHGPNLVGNLESHKYTLRSIMVIEKELEIMKMARGPSKSGAELCGRWLEAIGITRVFIRQPDQPLNTNGKWKEFSMESFINRLELRLHMLRAVNM